jgi:hypothetical protein
MEKIFLINIKDQLQFLKLTIKIMEMIRIKKIKNKRRDAETIIKNILQMKMLKYHIMR